jgi:hypothetical protein
MKADEMMSMGCIGQFRRTTGGACGAFLIMYLMMIAGRAHASPAPTSPILVLEAYGGRRPANVDRFMNPLRAELERRGFAARPETIIKLYGGRIPRPGVIDKGVTTAEILDLINKGYDAFSQAKFEEAARKLTDAIGKIDRDSALLVLDTGNQKAMYRAYVTLALSQSKLGLTDQAAETMAELLRIFRTPPLSRSEYGPTVEQFSRKIYKQISARAPGRLRINTRNPRAMIFVDRLLRGVDKVVLDDLIPGVYHLLVQEPQNIGLVYKVEVPEGGDVGIEAEWEIDSSLIVSPQWIGFEFPNDAERRKEATYGGTVARRCSGQESFAVVGTMKLQGRPALIGTLYRTTGKVLRSAFILLGDALDDADDATLGKLAQFLADGTPAAGIEIVVQNGEEAPASPTRRRSTLPAKLLIGAGAAVVIAGGVLYALDEDVPADTLVPAYFDSAKPGIALGVAGAVTIGAGVWLWTRSGRRSVVPFVSVGRSGGTIGLAWQR